MSAPARIWSPQQTRAIEWCRSGRGSAVLIAVAGAGKTTTGVACAEAFPGQVACMAFNKKPGDEFGEKLRAAGMDWKKAQAGTVHSFGNSGLKKAFPVLKDRKPDDKKVLHIVDEIAPDSPFKGMIAKMVGLAKQRALGVYGSIDDRSRWHDIIEHFDLLDTVDEDTQITPKAVEEIVTAGIATLYASNKMTDLIDYDDMVYLPVYHRLRLWRFQNLILDEAQDTNPARRALVRALLLPGGRLLAIGDPAQAIYGFTGADADSIEIIKREFHCIELPLTVSYRCPQAVVAFARQWVSHIEAHPSAPEGDVTSVGYDYFGTLVAKQADPASTAILSRTTKPLVELAFKLIRMGIACKVEGREIGAGIMALATRWKRVKTLPALREKLADHLARQTTKLLAKGAEDKIVGIEDQVETLYVLIDRCRARGGEHVEDLRHEIESLFGDDVQGMLVLSTIHKSKGREWNTVYWLDRLNTCPSKWARQAWQEEQEINLMYVAATRSKDKLIEIICPPPEPKGAKR